MVQTAVVAAITHSYKRVDGDIKVAVNASCTVTPLPKKYPANYSYLLSAQNIPFVRIPGVGDLMLPYSDHRPQLIIAAHEGLASAYAGGG